ncbi:MAG: hypothetical protein ABIF82_04690, partial [Planctomycetota bacterium]
MTIAINERLRPSLPTRYNEAKEAADNAGDQSLLWNHHSKESKILVRITAVRHVRDYRLELTFSNGVKAELDFKDRVVARGGVFEELEELD